MSIAKRLEEAIEKMARGDPEGALLPVCTAIDATATKHYGMRGRKSYKDFIDGNLGLVTRFAFGGVSVLHMRVKYSHPDAPKDADGMCTFQDVLYHVVRSGLVHKAALPDTLKFTSEGVFKVEEGSLLLPSALIFGFIIAVVACPANREERIGRDTSFAYRGLRLELNHVWGKKKELEDLFSAVEALTNGQ